LTGTTFAAFAAVTLLQVLLDNLGADSLELWRFGNICSWLRNDLLVQGGFNVVPKFEFLSQSRPTSADLPPVNMGLVDSEV
jgi:hypothetical protein